VISQAGEEVVEARHVLDHGYVRLVESMGSDLSIVRNARVSYDAVWRTGEDDGADAKLIRYLYRNKHTSPFESCTFTFEVKAPIFVLRQWHRHRTWSFNEVSARYAELPEEFYIPLVEHVGVQSTSNKQMREFAGVSEESKNFINDLQEHSRAGFWFYKQHLEAGIPRELARLFLGLNTYSHMFCTVDLHNLFHFLRLRLHEHSQYEIMVYAEAMLEIIKPIVPVAVEAFKESI
jgi:thymidylate synthase (FAD)